MEYRVLGQTGVQVSALCPGAMNFGSFANRDHDDCLRIMHAAFDAGVNFVDTADVYSQGESEEIVAAAVKGRRDKIVIATKQFHPMGPDVNQHGSSRRWINDAVDGSLRRLGTDHIDLYQVHRPDDLTSLEETLAGLSDVVRAGKVRMVGCCTYPAHLQAEARWVSERWGYERLVCNQPPYSILVRGIERDSLPTSQRYGMGVICWSPLASGWLTGRYRMGQALPDSPRWDAEINRPRKEGLTASPGSYRVLGDPTNPDTPVNARKLETAEALCRVADDAGIPMTHMALAFVLAHPAITSAIVGPRTLEQLQGQLGAVTVRLSDDVLDAIDGIVAPGTDVNPAEAGYAPPALTEAWRRRRGRGRPY